ncbi:TPA: hypothetical protein JFQ45_003367 [Legionella pneumophila]|nr:Uncharacterised protein [Legionella pneumophila]STY00662.1 Uncharacterised protein [Legionella pneumophila]VEF60361.1 Uncharacterised protein [Legionella pneumophila]HAT1782077.1 hypothetical protein [Legionella pneumophila]HAT1785421.1 hypothetical protein [Legionella pneumophila]
MRDYWLLWRWRYPNQFLVSVVGFLDEGLLVQMAARESQELFVSVVGFLDEGLLELL